MFIHPLSTHILLRHKGNDMPAKFQIKKARNGKFFFHLLAANGEVILSSQMYSTKATARKGVVSVKANASDVDQYETKKNRKGEHYFILKAKNQKVIGQSEGYSGTTGVKKGIKSVSTNAAKAGVEDITVRVLG